MSIFFLSFFLSFFQISIFHYFIIFDKVQPAEEIDDIFNDEMKKLILLRDKKAWQDEQASAVATAIAKPRTVHKFLNDALATNQVNLLIYIN
jgi:hypothetical protein